MAGLRVVVGWVLAVLLVGMSANSFVAEGTLTAEAWGFLLLTPLALAMALSPTAPWEGTDSGETGEWSNDEGSDEGEKDVPDPIESGFDIPVL
jgi:hypothetical protein|tara:strand:+ start:63 stop:341 length:279 start_codon:yes stop_codon:yes gene_type:complete